MTLSLTLGNFRYRRAMRPSSWTAAVSCSWLTGAGTSRARATSGAVTSVEEVADTARMVVGPDEPFDGHSQKDMEADHWACLAAVLRRQCVEVDSLELGRLPRDVVLGEQLLARLGHQPGADVQS